MIHPFRLRRIAALARPLACAFAVLAGTTAGARAQTPVKFTLDWRFEGPAAPFTMALDKGYFKAEGLDVTIDTGNGSRESIPRVATDATVSSTPFPTAAPSEVSTSTDTPDMQFASASGIVWTDFSSPGFDRGVKIAVLHGNPAAKGDYVLRLRFPAEYKFPVHWHPGGEHLTVLWGTFMLGMGSTNDWTTVRTYSPGDFLYVPARHSHFGGAGRGVTVIQLSGEGPFQLFLGSPK